MKSPSLFLIAALLITSLIGCASPTKAYDDHKIGRIQKDVTTETELLQWFGPASSRTLAPDGTKTLAWRFPPTNRRATASGGRIEVRLDKDGKVTTYSASGNTR